MPKQLRSWGEAKFYAESALAYARAYLEDSGLLSRPPETLRAYFDTFTFTPDMVLSSDVCETKFDGHHFVAGVW